MSDTIAVSLKNCHISPKKAVLMADVIRGLPIDCATSVLSHMPQKSAFLFGKLVKSLASNIENNHGQDYSDFVISEVFVTKGQVLKRLQQRAKGRADRRFKRYAHLHIFAKSK